MQRRTFVSSMIAAVVTFFKGRRVAEFQSLLSTSTTTTSGSYKQSAILVEVRPMTPPADDGSEEMPHGPFEEVVHVDIFTLFEEVSAYARKHNKPVFASDDPTRFPPLMGWCCDSSEPGAYGKHWLITPWNLKRSLDNSSDSKRVEIVWECIKTAEGRGRLAQALSPRRRAELTSV